LATDVAVRLRWTLPVRAADGGSLAGLPEHDAELDAIVDMLEAAGLAERYVTEEGSQAMRLWPKGTHVAGSLAMDTDAGETVLDALLDAIEGGTVELHPAMP
jgi:hypothetical protein